MTHSELLWGHPPDREILFPTLSENGEKQYADLLKGNEVEKYVEAHPNMTEQQIASYAKILRAKYNEIDERNLRKLVRNEVNRKVGTMLYDLDWDIQLTEALSILAKENFSELVKKTKTLKELQDEVEKKEKTEKK